MIGGGYEEPPLHDSERPLGKARARHVRVTSSNAAFAESLTKVGMSEDSIQEREREHHKVRNEWLERFRPSTADFRIIGKRRFLNNIVELVHLDPVSQIGEISLFDHFPPPEPKPPLKEGKLWRPLRWLLGDELYRQKISALNRVAMYRKADEKTRVHPLANAILGTVAHNARNPEGTAQNHEYVAARVLDGSIKNQRVILGSPLYLALSSN
jgi:Family of unknown function (DUF7019)